MRLFWNTAGGGGVLAMNFGLGSNPQLELGGIIETSIREALEAAWQWAEALRLEAVRLEADRVEAWRAESLRLRAEQMHELARFKS